MSPLPSDKIFDVERPTAGHAGSEACGEVVRPGGDTVGISSIHGGEDVKIPSPNAAATASVRERTSSFSRIDDT
jgi:hypothetical protein